jgi:hypothetical protein
MKKSILKENVEDVQNIEETTKLYATYVAQEKEAKSKAERFKTRILDYAGANADKFDGKTLTLPNGVRVENRTTLKADWNSDAVDVAWVMKACAAELDEAITIKIDPKELPETLGELQAETLNEISFGVREESKLAVVVSRL